jgi:hypothetical protein
MSSQLEPTRSRPPVVRKAVAGLVLLIAAAIAIKLVIGTIIAVVTVIAIVAVIAAVLWAVGTLL